MPETTSTAGALADQPNLVVARDQLAVELTERTSAGEQFKVREVAGLGAIQQLADEVMNWHEYNATLLKRSFSTSEIADDYLGFSLYVDERANPAEKYRQVGDFINDRIHRLVSLSSRLPLYAELLDGNSTSVPNPSADAQDIFIVHGHNESVKLSVAHFIRQVTGRNPTILHEQPNAGRTVLEKFEHYAENAGFAVVLLTADDTGGARGSEDSRLRARQNVILEFGFFIGALGRNRVAALHESGVELPSDLGGLLYTSLDSEWRIDLGREMRAAGVEIDFNKMR